MNENQYRENAPLGERSLLEGCIHYLSILKKYRWLLLVTTILAVLTATALCVAGKMLPPEESPLPDTYTANAVVLVLKGMGDNLSATILTALGIESRTQDFAVGFDTGELVLLVLRSRTILDKITEEPFFGKRFNVADRPKSKLRDLLLSKCHFQYNRTTAAITITVEDIDPVFARDAANSMASLVNEWFAQNLSSTNLKQKQLLDDKVKEVRADIDQREDRLKSLQTKYGVLTAQDLGTSQATTLAALRSQLILKEIDIKNYSAVSAIEDPKLQQLRAERKNILDLIAQTQQSIPDVQGSTVGQKNLPDLQLEFNNLTVELDIQRKIYDTLSHQREVLKLTSQSESAFQILDLAEVPDRKSGPSRIRIIAIAGLVAFGLSGFLAVLLNSLEIRKGGARRAATSKALS